MTQVANNNRNNADARSVMSTKEAALFLGISYRTLEDWRLTGRGPQFVKLGRLVRYLRTALLDFMDQNSFTNTGAALAT